jgi:hypothetical protein
MVITLVSVESRAIKAIGYDNSTLRVEFHQSGLYEYLRVPAAVVLEFLNAPSLGRYFDHHIKDTYACRKVR